MTEIPKDKMNVLEFLTWADALPGDSRYELDRGVPVAMAPGTAQHVRAIMAAANALAASVKSAGVPCELFVDGPGVKVDDATAYIPDVSLNCGERMPDDARFLTNPIAVVEVLSPSTKRMDKHIKLNGYFKIASIRHYAVVDLADRIVFHHRRGDDGLILTAILREGDLKLDPPGLTLPLADMFG
jgi:Uma2 family endonuclease